MKIQVRGNSNEGHILQKKVRNKELYIWKFKDISTSKNTKTMGALFSCASKRNKVGPNEQSSRSRKQKRGSKRNTNKVFVSTANERDQLLLISAEDEELYAEDELKPDRFRPRNPSPPVTAPFTKDDVVETELLDESSMCIYETEPAIWNTQQQQRMIEDHANICGVKLYIHIFHLAI